MMVDVTKPLKDLDDEPIVQSDPVSLDGVLLGVLGDLLPGFVSAFKAATGDAANPTPVTARRAIVNALMAADPKLEGSEKLKRFTLAALINKKAKVDLTVEQIALIKTEVARGYGPLVVGRVYELVDPACLKDPAAD